MAYSLTMSTPCAKYSLPVSAAVATFSLTTFNVSVATGATWKKENIRWNLTNTYFDFVYLTYSLKVSWAFLALAAAYSLLALAASEIYSPN